jgi:hypothetical protein
MSGIDLQSKRISTPIQEESATTTHISFQPTEACALAPVSPSGA